MTKHGYDKVEKFFNNHSALMWGLKIIYQFVPLFVFLGYPVMLLVLFIIYGIQSPMLLKVTIVPACTFVLVTILRKVFNFQRPYEKYDIHPIISKNKKGQSFPSRHSVSIFIIAMSFLYVNIYAGIAYFFIGTLMCISRVLCGVHFIRDVAAGALLSIAIGTVFLFLI